jgi:hypothetical protein
MWCSNIFYFVEVGLHEKEKNSITLEIFYRPIDTYVFLEIV